MSNFSIINSNRVRPQSVVGKNFRISDFNQIPNNGDVMVYDTETQQWKYAKNDTTDQVLLLIEESEVTLTGLPAGSFVGGNKINTSLSYANFQRFSNFVQVTGVIVLNELTLQNAPDDTYQITLDYVPGSKLDSTFNMIRVNGQETNVSGISTFTGQNASSSNNDWLYLGSRHVRPFIPIQEDSTPFNLTTISVLKTFTTDDTSASLEFGFHVTYPVE